MNARALGVAGALFYIVLWASAFVPSKVGVVGTSPLWFLVVRFTVSGLLALALARALGARMPRGRREWVAAVVYGLLGNAVYLGCTYVALRHIASGIGAIVASTNPLALALAAPWLLREPLTPLKLGGLLLGFGGVVAIMIVRAGTGSADPGDVALAFAGVLGSVGSTIVFKRWCADLDLRAVNAVQLLAAAIVLLPLAPALEGMPHARWSWELIVSFWYVVLVMSLGASLLWFWLLAHGEASRVSAYYFLTPVFGLALAALLLHEPVGARDLGGLAAIALGISLVQRG
ncbi:MAG: DMT family transporter [Candidatus Eremiobacteraeota bacterium]|nr:DMT family transporter [Candidatus Eremiobacteraeota bacterium]